MGAKLLYRNFFQDQCTSQKELVKGRFYSTVAVLYITAGYLRKVLSRISAPVNDTLYYTT